MSHRSHRATLAATVAASLAAASAGLLAGAGPAAAAAPRAQAVGRFLDGAAGGNPIQQIADLHDARATNPGTVTDQNPLDVTLGGQGTVPLSGKLQGPGGGVFTVGAANQVAKALSNGYSYGAAGAVANSGGASLGGNNAAFPSSATINLSAAALPSPGSLPLPGAGNAAALGGLSAQIGGISALASTPAGFGRPGSTAYSIASFTLKLDSPALGSALGTISTALEDGLGKLSTAAGATKLPRSCSFEQSFGKQSLDNGSVVIDAPNAAITLDIRRILQTLGLDLDSLPPNTDLIAEVLNYLRSNLATGVQDVIAGITNQSTSKFSRCLAALNKSGASGPIGKVTGLLLTLTDTLQTGQQQFQSVLDGLTSQLSTAGGANPFAPLTDGLKQALQIGVNVQPHAASHGYTSPLAATPDQATPVVAGQTLVRALEIDLGGGQLSLALANAAAGPSTVEQAAAPPAPPAHPATHTPQGAPNTVIPTGVPAGQGPVGGGPPTLPLVLLALAVLMGGAGAVAWRLRPNRH